jgi:hypothetical protein
MAIGTHKWNGSSWITAPIKKWNGSSWADAYTYKWNGSSWVQIYPETIVSKSYTLSSGGKFRSWRDNGYETTTTVSAKQGPWESYSAASGYLDTSSKSLPGSKNVSSVSSAKMTAVRGGAGYYNANQTIYFYRSAQAPNATPSDLTGQFTTTTGAPGNGKTMSNRTVTTGTNLTNWLNQVSSKPYLWIYTTNESQYLSIQTSFKIAINYEYLATTALFADDGSVSAFNMTNRQYKEIRGEQAYHSMPIYNDEVGMSLYEIMDRREQGIVEDIDPTSVIITSEIKPWFREYEIYQENGENKFKIEAMNLNENTEVQYSLDNTCWYTMYGIDLSNYVYCTLPNDFDKYKHNIYVRIVDNKLATIDAEVTIEPDILII